MATDIEIVRYIVYDFYDSNPVVQEDLSAQVNGTAQTFYCEEYKSRAGKAIWDSSLCESVSSTIPFTPPFSINYDSTINAAATAYSLSRGSFTVNTGSTATPGPVNSLFVDYYFQLQTDGDYTQFLSTAVNWVDVGTQVISQMLPKHQEAVHLYAAFLAARAISRRAADLVNQAAGQVRADLDNISKKYETMAEQLNKDATTMRNEQYMRSGQREAPVMNYVQLTCDAQLWTPPR